MGWLWWWWWWLVSCDGGWMLVVGFGFIEEWVRESLTRQGRGERKKIIIYKVTVTMHVAILHINSVLNKLMWIVFEQKCVKLCKICNFFYFARTSTIALTILYTSSWLHPQNILLGLPYKKDILLQH